MNLNCQRREPLRANDGFTLVEIMVAAFVGTLVIALSMTSFIALSRAAAGSVNAASVHSELRLVMDHASRELTAGSEVTYLSPGSYIKFNVLTEAGTEMRYLYHYRYGKLFYIYRHNKWKVLMEDVDDVTFTLYDADGAVTTTPDEAMSVGLQISGTREWAGQSYSDSVYAQVLLRNKDGE